MEKIFKDIENHLMEDVKPSIYLNELLNKGIIRQAYPLNFLWDLVNVPQSPKHHPEGSVWNHTVMVVDEAAMRKDKSEDMKVFMWAALLHDIGKSKATKLRKGRITAYDHDKYGEKMSVDFLKEFKCNEDFIKKVSALVRWHMQTLFIVKNLPYAELDRMLEDVNFKEIALLSLCDRLGRGELNEDKIKEEENNISNFIKVCELKLKEKES